jgi:hypothetical protein
MVSIYCNKIQNTYTKLIITVRWITKFKYRLKLYCYKFKLFMTVFWYLNISSWSQITFQWHLVTYKNVDKMLSKWQPFRHLGFFLNILLASVLHYAIRSARRRSDACHDIYFKVKMSDRRNSHLPITIGHMYHLFFC